MEKRQIRIKLLHIWRITQKNAQLFLLLEIMPVETWTDLDLTRSKKDGFMLESQSMDRFLCVGGVIVWIMLYTVPKL